MSHSITTRHRIRVALASIAAAGLALTLTGCGAFQAVADLGNPVGRGLYETESTFSKTAVAKTLSTAWIPDDATMVRLTYRNDGSAALIMFHTTSSLDEFCKPAKVVPQPALEDSWWPQTLPGSAYLCGEGWTAFASGDATFAFIGTDTNADTSMATNAGTGTAMNSHTNADTGPNRNADTDPQTGAGAPVHAKDPRF